MSETLTPRPLRAKAPLLAGVLFALAYGSIMVLILSPRGFLLGDPGNEVSPVIIPAISAEFGAGESTVPKILSGAVIRPVGLDSFGISD